MEGFWRVFDLVVELAALFGCVWLFLVFPWPAGRKRRAPFAGRCYAHRGLYEKDQSVPENSLEAFARAAAAGYGVELDVQLTRDGQPVVFHDDSLVRACGAQGKVCDYALTALRELPLFGTAHRVPLLADALDALARGIDAQSGRPAPAPLIVELKSCPKADRSELCEKTLALLSAYPGPFCVESFDPFLVRYLYKHAPDVTRGQLTQAYRYSRKGLPGPLAFLMSRALSNFATRPHFLAYRYGEKCLSARACELLGAMRVVWTIRSPSEFGAVKQRADCVIFEHFLPEARF